MLQEPKKASLVEKFFENITTAGALKIIAILGFIVFFNALFNQFAWDDIVFVLHNPDIQTLNIFSHFSFNGFNSNGYYRPLFTTYLALLYNFFGQNAFFYHSFQITLHIINASLLFYFLKNFVHKKIALFFSLIFLLHPIQTESVSWISATLIPLSFLFNMLALNLISKEKITTRNFVIIFILLLFSVFTQEIGFLFFPVILFYIFFFRKKITLKVISIEALVFLLYCFVRFGLMKIYLGNNMFSTIQRLNFAERIINIPSIIFYYVKNFFFPTRFLSDQMWTIKQLTFSNFYIPLIFDFIFISVFFATGMYLYLHKKNMIKMYLFFSLWFIAGFILLLQIFPIDMTVADRWFYFPLAGLVGMLAIIARALSSKINTKIVFAVSLFILIFLSFKTMVRNIDWYSDLTLKSHDIKYESNFDIENNYGTALMGVKNYNEAIVHYKKSVELYPYENNLYNLGFAYFVLGNDKEAEKYYYKAYHAKSYTQKPHLRLEIVYSQIANFQIFTKKNYREAKRISEEGLKDYPRSAVLWLFLGLSEYGLNNKDGALRAIDTAYLIKPTQQIYSVYSQINDNKSLKEIYPNF